MPNYTPLRNALEAAYAQSSEGKGQARHANGRDFDRQPIMEIGRMVGPGFQIGQSMKKAQEAIGMIARGDFDAAEGELLGGIVYLAAAVALIHELRDAARPAKTAAQEHPITALQRAANAIPDNRLSAAMTAVDKALNGG